MDFLTDWKFWSFILAFCNFIGVILVGCFNYFSHQKITTNDLKHLSDDVKEVKEEQKCIKEKVIHLGETVAGLEVKVYENFKSKKVRKSK